MAVCPSCQREVKDGAAFCSYCGTTITQDVATDGPIDVAVEQSPVSYTPEAVSPYDQSAYAQQANYQQPQPQQPQPQYYAQQSFYVQGGYAPQPVKQTPPMAIASLICGIGGFIVFPVVLGVVAIILGQMAIKNFDPATQSGIGMAKAGKILGIVGLAIWAAVICCYVAIIVGVLGSSYSYY